jgi:hypothetical protein
MSQSAWLTHGEWVMASLTLVYVLLTAFYAWTSHRTLEAIQEQALQAKNDSISRDRQFTEQLKVSQDAAIAAKASADALMNSERAWFTSDVSLDTTKGKILFEDDGQVVVNVVISCANIGRSPGWITEIRADFRLADDVPEMPSRQSIPVVNWHPGLVSVNKEEAFQWQFSCTGRIADRNKMMLIYGLIDYRDIFEASRQTSFGYSVTSRPFGAEIERLTMYPEYNKQT